MNEIERATNARSQLQESRNRLIDEMTKDGNNKTRTASSSAALSASNTAKTSSGLSKLETERHYNYRTGGGKEARNTMGVSAGMRHRSAIEDDENKNNNDSEQLVTASFKSNSDFYELNKNSKRWRSMYALRDSIRNLTSCVSTKSSNLANKYS